MTPLLTSVPENDFKISPRAANVGASGASESTTFQAVKNHNSQGKYAHAVSEDPNLMPGNSKHILRRRRSHLNRWIQDQQYHTHTGPDDACDVVDDTESTVLTVGTPCNPYLAYPHLGVASFHPRTLNEVGSLHNYVVVDDIPDDDEEVEDDRTSVDSEGAEHMSPLPSPALDSSSQIAPSSKRRSAPSSFRNLPIFRSSRNPSISMSGESSTSRLSLFRSSRQSTSTVRSTGYKHTKASSLSTLNLSPTGIPVDVESTRGTTSDASTWRWKSGVLGHFSSTPAVPQAHLLSAESHPPPRPSTSSTYTYSSAITPPTTMCDHEGSELLTVPSKMPLLNSIRSRAKLPSRHALFGSGSVIASVPSLWSSGRTSISHTLETSGSTARSALRRKESAIRIPSSQKTKDTQLPSTSENDDAPSPLESEQQIPHVVYPNGKSSKSSRLSLSSLSAPVREKNKKKLIVSGIEAHDVRRFAAMRAWCESFGEVTQIVRVPNGDLHVHFRKAEVADTVCRVRAKVNISGVGSVHLSWFTGEKR